LPSPSCVAFGQLRLIASAEWLSKPRDFLEHGVQNIAGSPNPRVALYAEGSIIQFLVNNGAKLDARHKLGWTPLMVTEGGQFGVTVKEFPESAAFFRKLMSERGMDPDQYSKAFLLSTFHLQH
jgi:hypothetical protein